MPRILKLFVPMVIALFPNSTIFLPFAKKDLRLFPLATTEQGKEQEWRPTHRYLVFFFVRPCATKVRRVSAASSLPRRSPGVHATGANRLRCVMSH